MHKFEECGFCGEKPRKTSQPPGFTHNSNTRAAPVTLFTTGQLLADYCGQPPGPGQYLTLIPLSGDRYHVRGMEIRRPFGIGPCEKLNPTLTDTRQMDVARKVASLVDRIGPVVNRI